MEIFLSDNQTPTDKVNLCLGQFDSIHLGHQRIINAAVKDGSTFVYSFGNDLSPYLPQKRGFVYTTEERKNILFSLGVDGVIFDDFDENLMNLSGEEFLDRLFSIIGIKALYLGEDYRFGRGGEWNAEYLKKHFENTDVEVKVIETENFDGEKASTSLAKELLACGDVARLIRLLGRPYTITSTVERGFQNGGKLGFKTANFRLPREKTRLLEGVYLGYADVDGKHYGAIINAGGRPTYQNDEYKIETHVDGWFPDLYGKTLTVGFCERTRDIVRFESTEELKAQLQRDLNELRAKYGNKFDN